MSLNNCSALLTLVQQLRNMDALPYGIENYIPTFLAIVDKEIETNNQLIIKTYRLVSELAQLINIKVTKELLNSPNTFDSFFAPDVTISASYTVETFKLGQMCSATSLLVTFYHLMTPVRQKSLYSKFELVFKRELHLCIEDYQSLKNQYNFLLNTRVSLIQFLPLPIQKFIKPPLQFPQYQTGSVISSTSENNQSSSSNSLQPTVTQSTVLTVTSPTNDSSPALRQAGKNKKRKEGSTQRINNLNDPKRKNKDSNSVSSSNLNDANLIDLTKES